MFVLMLIKSFVGLIPWLRSIGFAVLESIMVYLFSVVLLKLGHYIVGHENWYFTDSGSNLDDIPYRRASLSNLKDKDLWYSGPKQVLYSDTPPTRFSILCKYDLFALLSMDTKNEKLVNLNSIIDFKRFSNYLKLLRVTSCLMCFINRLKNK